MAVKSNFVVDQGSVFHAEIFLTDENKAPFDLDGYQAASQIRKTYSSPSAIAVYDTTVNTATSSIVLHLAADVTSTIPQGRYVYDVEVTDGLETLRVLEGIVTVSPEVTR